MAFTKINAAGIGTTETVTVDGLTVINDGSFGGNLSVGGTITYEDVTNVDSVGIITARAGVLVGSGITLSKDGDVFFTGIATGNGSGLTALNASNIGSGTVPTARLGSGTASSSTFLRGDSTFQTVNTDLVSDTSPQLGGNLDVNTKNIVFGDSGGATDDRLTFGAGTDLHIYFDGSNSFIKEPNSVAGQLIIDGYNGTDIRQGSTGDLMGRFVGGGAVELYHDNSKKLETTSAGVSITGELDIADGSFLDFGNGGLRIRTNANNAYITEGTSGKLEISASNLQFSNAAASQTYAYFTDGGSANLYYAGSSKLETTSSGVTVSGDTSTGSLLKGVTRFCPSGSTTVKVMWDETGFSNAGHFQVKDGVAFTAGNSSDLKIYHDGSDSVITSGQGGLKIINSANNQHLFLKKATGGDIRILDSSDNSTHIFETGGALRFLGSQTREGNSNSILTGGNNSLDFNGSEYMYFRTNNVERARFQMSNNGYFQVGRSGNTPANAHVGVAVQNTICAIQTISDGTSGNEHIRFNNPNGEVGRIMTTGNSTVYYTSSDYRLKENDVAISDGVARVKQLRPIKFNWKSNPSETVEGFFAHEVQAIVPEAVDGSKDQVVTQADIDEGKWKQDQLGDPLYQAYDASYMVPVLTAAIKELITRVENLESA